MKTIHFCRRFFFFDLFIKGVIINNHYYLLSLYSNVLIRLWDYNQTVECYKYFAWSCQLFSVILFPCVFTTDLIVVVASVVVLSVGSKGQVFATSAVR